MARISGRDPTTEEVLYSNRRLKSQAGVAHKVKEGKSSLAVQTRTEKSDWQPL